MFKTKTKPTTTAEVALTSTPEPTRPVVFDQELARLRQNLEDAEQRAIQWRNTAAGLQSRVEALEIERRELKTKLDTANRVGAANLEAAKAGELEVDAIGVAKVSGGWTLRRLTSRGDRVVSMRTLGLDVVPIDTLAGNLRVSMRSLIEAALDS